MRSLDCAMNLKSGVASHLMWVSVDYRLMQESRNLSLLLLAMVPATYLVASCLIRQGRVILVLFLLLWSNNSRKHLHHIKCPSHRQICNSHHINIHSHLTWTMVNFPFWNEIVVLFWGSRIEHIIGFYWSFANLVAAGYNSQQSIASPGPGKGRSNRGPPGPGPATPKQNHSIPYQDPRSPQLGRQSPISQQQLRIPDVGNQLADLDPDQLPPNQKREGPDWYAVFNPRIRRVLDVDLVHNLLHESVVCCVRFSSDGRYVATGCNRSAQIFEVSSGSQVAKLQDDSVDKDGDLYIRSVCFSPDGKYLATGAEDKQIRVRYLPVPV